MTVMIPPEILSALGAVAGGFVGGFVGGSRKVRTIIKEEVREAVDAHAAACRVPPLVMPVHTGEFPLTR